MLPDSITLAVDELHTSSDTNHVYSRYNEFLNRSVYNYSEHSLVAPDTLTFYRTFPKVNGNFRGVAKCAMKFSQAIVVDGVDGLAQITSPILLEVSWSLPVGTSSAQAMLARQRAVAALDDDTNMELLNDQLSV